MIFVKVSEWLAQFEMRSVKVIMLLIDTKIKSR